MKEDKKMRRIKGRGRDEAEKNEKEDSLVGEEEEEKVERRER